MKNSTDTLYTRALTEEDTETVFMLDEKSGNCVSEWLKGNTDFAWGFFKEDQLIGYCTTGYADDCPFSIEDHPLHTCDSILLSNVFILPEFRHHGYGSKMVTNAILNRWESDRVQNAVFLTVVNLTQIWLMRSSPVLTMLSKMAPMNWTFTWKCWKPVSISLWYASIWVTVSLILCRNSAKNMD